MKLTIRHFCTKAENDQYTDTGVNNKTTDATIGEILLGLGLNDIGKIFSWNEIFSFSAI